MRPHAAVNRRANQLEFRIIILGLGVSAHVEADEAQRARHGLMVGGIGQAEVVEVHQAFAVVEPIRSGGELAMDGMEVVLQLPGGSIPETEGEFAQALVTAQGIEQRKVVEALRRVVGRCGASCFPDQRAPAARVTIGEADGCLAHLTEQLTFQRRPPRRGHRYVGLYDLTVERQAA